ncbi:MAG: hypothetical protein IID40_04635, partial [Planctomycetes bacterium]|nr:hypothetical protein [Planctomycetota bacterium]
SLKRLLERAGWRLVKVHTLEPVLEWPWTLTTMMRKPRGARPLEQSGELTRRFPYPLTAAAAHVYRILSWPLRCLQGGLKGGGELLVVAQANP